jgi:hypothetical protein
MVNPDLACVLRYALVAYAGSSGATGLLPLPASPLLAGLLGLSEPLLRVAAVSLLPFALFLAWTSMQTRPAATAAWIIQTQFFALRRVALKGVPA